MNYWHLQLHPGEFEDWGVDGIREILNQSLIGCTGKPVKEFYNINIGDIILVRHGGNIIALTQALEKPRLITPEERND
jgi:5-methylcytosine-specific restriction enzyme B